MKRVVLFTLMMWASLVASESFAQTKPAAKPAVKKPATTTKPAVKAPVKKPATTIAKAKPVVKDKSIRVKITTDSGVIVVKLSDSTPLHRDNFVKLVKQGFYDSL